MKKKLLSLILSVLVVLSVIAPFSAFASPINTARTAENIALNATASQTYKYGYPTGTYDSSVQQTEKYYMFTAPTTDYYEFQLTGYENTEYVDGHDASDYIYLFLRDSNDNSEGSTTVNAVTYLCKRAWKLTKGQTYYIEVDTYLYDTKAYKAKDYGYAEQTLKLSVKKHTHSMKVDYQSAYYTYYACDYCDYNYSKEKTCKHTHTKKTVTKAATYWSTGLYNLYCTDCGSTFKTNVKLAKKKAPIKAAKAGKKKAVVSWKKVNGATGYQVQYSTKSDFKGAKTVKVKSAKATSKTIKKLKKGTKYYFRVKAVKGGKSSSWSKTKSVKVK